MQVTSVGSASPSSVGGAASFAKAKQSFDALGSALAAGNLSDASKALAELQQSAPAQASKGAGPLATEMDKLSQALGSGDLEGAKAAYNDIKKAVSQRPSGPPPGRGGGPPRGAQGGAAGGSTQASQSSSSSTSLVYDKKDTNKDGVVSAEEEMAYDLKHPMEASQQAGSGGLLDTTA